METAMRRCLQAIIKDAAQFEEPAMEFRGRAGGSLGTIAAAPHALVPRLLALAIILAKGKHIDHSEFWPFPLAASLHVLFQWLFTVPAKACSTSAHQKLR